MKKTTLFFIPLLLAACVKDRLFDTGNGSGTSGIPVGVVKINEIAAAGSTDIPNEFGTSADWFEIYNPDTATYTMHAGKWFFTDTPGSPTEYAVPVDITIPGHGFKVIYCDSRDTVATQIHTNFNLSSQGENVVITYNDGTNSVTVDAHAFPAQTTAQTTGRLPDGGDTWSTTLVSTPGASNHQ